MWISKLDSVFLLLNVLIGSLDLVLCGTHYIVPTLNYSCFVDSCLTLSQFADNLSNYIDSSTILFIAGGNHSLDIRISVSNVDMFSMLSVNDTEYSSVFNCNEHSNFNLFNVDHVRISGLTFIHCGDNGIESVNQLTIKNSTFVGKHDGGCLLYTSDAADE